MNDRKVLVLGHGQLGLMMAAEAAKLGAEMDRLDLVTGERLCGTSPRRDPLDEDTLFSHYNVITAELEHLPDTDLIRRIKATPQWMNHPAFELLVDRATQKSLIDELALATAPWRKLNHNQDLDTALNELGGKLVVKTTRGGYDGRGQWRIDPGNRNELPGEAFGSLIAESLVDFRREVSVIGARAADGSSYFLPLAENIHKTGILRYSIVRGEDSPALLEQGRTMLSRMMQRLDYVGVLAMECFETEEGLSINELAPRVHNSGHWSQLGAINNQFALHNRALLGLPLPTKETHRPTIMLNLIGCPFVQAWLGVEGIQVHWYGKELRQGRKMGHINIDASDKTRLNAAVKSLSGLLDDTHGELLNEALNQY